MIELPLVWVRRWPLRSYISTLNGLPAVASLTFRRLPKASYQNVLVALPGFAVESWLVL
jgi:hypothetical protein